MQAWSIERFTQFWDLEIGCMKGADRVQLYNQAVYIKELILDDLDLYYNSTDYIKPWRNALCELLDVLRALYAGAPLPIATDDDRCWRCLGEPRAFEQFSHINDGKCLRCNGTLKEKPRQRD